LTSDRVVLDTNFLIRHGIDEVLNRGLLSAVVLQEITAGAREDSAVRKLQTVARRMQTEGKLVVPTGEDWFYTGKVLSALMRGVPSVRGPRSHAIDKGEQQRLVRDVLIARSAKRVNAAVVTYNAGDFEKIRRFCNVRLIPPADYL
jgi:predicted nucleic acid-binding protein